MRFAYADPPYLGLAEKFYGDLHPEAADYDQPEAHQALIERLCSDYDGWALSLHTPSLRVILPMCPPEVRVCAWVKPFASFKANVRQAYAWEPILVSPLRRLGNERVTITDWVAAGITLQRGLTGAKPAAVCNWIFEFAGLEPDDEFVDLFPGSGAVSQAWERWRVQPHLLIEAHPDRAPNQAEMGLTRD